MINPKVKSENISSEVRFDEETDKWVAHVVEWVSLNFLEKICEWIWGEKDYEYSVETIWTCSNRGTHTIWTNVDDPDDIIPWWLAQELRVQVQCADTKLMKVRHDSLMKMRYGEETDARYREVTDLDMVLMPIK